MFQAGGLHHTAAGAQPVARRFIINMKRKQTRAAMIPFADFCRRIFFAAIKTSKGGIMFNEGFSWHAHVL